MESKFIELISDEELEKLREAVKLTKELAIFNRESNIRKTFDDLYGLKNDCDRIFLTINKMQQKNKLCKIKMNNEERFNYSVPNMLYSLLNAIENGDLIFKDAKI